MHRHLRLIHTLAAGVTAAGLLASASAATAQFGVAGASSGEIVRARSVLLGALPNADGARTRDVTLTRVSGATVFCGAVSAREQGGVDASYEPFIVFGNEAKVYSDQQPWNNFQEMWRLTCNGGHKVPVPTF